MGEPWKMARRSHYAEAVEYLQTEMKKQDKKAPEITVDNQKYIYRNQYYPFTLKKPYAKLKL